MAHLGRAIDRLTQDGLTAGVSRGSRPPPSCRCLHDGGPALAAHRRAADRPGRRRRRRDRPRPGQHGPRPPLGGHRRSSPKLPTTAPGWRTGCCRRLRSPSWPPSGGWPQPSSATPRPTRRRPTARPSSIAWCRCPACHEAARGDRSRRRSGADRGGRPGPARDGLSLRDFRAAVAAAEITSDYAASVVAAGSGDEGMRPLLTAVAWGIHGPDSMTFEDGHRARPTDPHGVVPWARTSPTRFATTWDPTPTSARSATGKPSRA